METVFIALGSGILYLIAYHTYGKWLAKKIFQLDPNRETPAIKREDGKDYVPSKKSIVFGHHFTSIAGTGPIVGPAIAVIWGWVPALIWVVFGSIFIGAVHDFAALAMSLRNQGRTIGDYCGDIINPRVRILFMVIIFFALWIVIAIFGLVIAAVFAMFPQSVFPVWFQIPIAVGLGIWVKRGGNLAIGSIVALALMYLTIFLSSHFEFLQFKIVSETVSPVGIWTVLLMIYCFIASVLPVNVLLQPRDFINSHQLLLAMGLLIVGLLIARPEMVAPATNFKADIGAPFSILPFLFITVACGACSGFHCLVGSGTSSKQLTKETDAQYVGYGSMLLESFLAVLVIIATCAGIGMGFNGFTGHEAWLQNYSSWSAASGLGAKVGAAITGGGNMMGALGLPTTFTTAIMSVFIASFAATTLDSATRLQRYVLTELATTIRPKSAPNMYIMTAIAVGTGMLLAFYDVFTAETLSKGIAGGGKGAMSLWPLFGATNQLLAGLALLVATVWLYRKQKPIFITAVPMVFMLFMTGWGLINQITSFINPAEGKSANYMLFSLGLVILLLELWMVGEAVIYLVKLKGIKNSGEQLPEMLESA